MTAPRAPVVLVAFNRPELTRRTMGAIRAAGAREVFVVADGPRAGRPDDLERCRAVREAVATLGTDLPVRTRLRDENLGCEGNVETGLDWVFSQAERAIVLEDDCVPDPTFFRYADELLERYGEDPRVWHIAGNRLGVREQTFGDRSYAFSTWASVWGWATWADRWQRHREVFVRDHVRRSPEDRGDAPLRRVPADPRPGALVTRAAERHFREAAASDDVVTHGWDKHWWLTIMSERGLSVTPAINLVENAGFGAEATHGLSDREAEPAAPMPFPMRHPDRVELAVEVERELELALARVGGRAAMLARRAVRSPRVRRLLRRAADSRAATAAARAASRLGRRSQGEWTRDA